jgi:ketosteroid isomerase-like protein
MFKHNFKIALRNLRRHKIHSIITIGGLAVSMSLCLLVALWLYGFAHTDSSSPLGTSDEQEIIKTLAQISSQFSAAYVQGDIAKLVPLYSADAVIFPGNSDLIRGKEAIEKYWTLPPGRTITHHKITSVEIKIMGEFAYDYGYYEISGRNNGTEWGPNYGKYLIVWKRTRDGAWKMHLDMWNSGGSKEQNEKSKKQ